MSRFGLLGVLNLRQIARQPSRSLLAVIAVAAGVAITVATGHLVTSMQRSISDVYRSLSGPAPLAVSGYLFPSGLDVQVTERVERTPGVAAAVPTVLGVAVADTAGGDEIHFLALGVDCRVEALIGGFDCDAQTFASASRTSPVLMASVLDRALGSDAELRTNIGRFPIGDVAVNDSLNGTNQGRIAIFDLSTAQRLFGRTDRIDAVYVQPEAGVEIAVLQARLQNVVGEHNVIIRRGEIPPYMGIGGPLLPLLGFAGTLALGLSGLLVYNIVALSLAERRRDHAIAAAVGASSRAITRGILVEAGVLGLAGGVLGAIAGYALAPVLVETISSVLLEQAIGMRASTYASPPVIATGIVLGALTGAIAAFFPAWRTRRLDLAAELHGRAAQTEDAPRRLGSRLVVTLAAGGAAIVGSYIAQSGGALELWQSPLGTVSIVAAGVALLTAVGTAAPILLGSGVGQLRATRGRFRLAVSNLVGRPRRTTVVAASVGSAVALACVLGSVIPSMKQTTRRDIGNVAAGRVYVSTLPMNNAGGAATPSDAVVRAIERLPGVRSVTPNRCITIASGVSSRGEGLAVCSGGWRSRVPPFAVVAGDASMDALRRGEAIIGTSAARVENVRPGSMLSLTTPTGFVNVRVAGIWRSFGANGHMVTLSEQRFIDLYGPDRAENFWVTPDEGVSADTLADRIEAARLDPDLYALTPVEAAERLAGEVGEQVTPFWMLQRLLLFVALIATLSTLLLVGVQRRREFGILGATGFGPGSLARLTITEALIAGAIGAILGGVASLGLFEVLRNVSAVALGRRPPFTFDVPSALYSSAIALVIVAIGGVLPAWRASRLQIVEAIRDE